jgi:hypothetical protein
VGTEMIVQTVQYDQLFNSLAIKENKYINLERYELGVQFPFKKTAFQSG